MTLANPFTHDPQVYNEAKTLMDTGHKVTFLAWDNKGMHPENEVIDEINVVRRYIAKLMDMIEYNLLCYNY
jgi:hypothetical protein